MVSWVGGWANRERLVFLLMDGRIDGRMDGWMEGRMDGWMDGWIRHASWVGGGGCRYRARRWTGRGMNGLVARSSCAACFSPL